LFLLSSSLSSKSLPPFFTDFSDFSDSSSKSDSSSNLLSLIAANEPSYVAELLPVFFSVPWLVDGLVTCSLRLDVTTTRAGFVCAG